MSLTGTCRLDLIRGACICAMLAFTSVQGPAHAALFDDDEARKAILDLRTKVDANRNEINSRLDKLDAASRSQLEFANQIETLRQDIAKLRGQIETMTNELASQQKREKDYYADFDSRLRKLEPQQLVVDGKNAAVAPDESRAYEAALQQFKNSDFKGAIGSFGSFVNQYPKSAYTPAAQYWIGTSYYAERDYKGAIAAQQMVVKNWPESPRAADALLNIASSQADSADKKSARKTLETLIAQYPDAPAAATARERLPKLK